MDTRLQEFAQSQGWDVDVSCEDDDMFLTITIPSLEKTNARIEIDLPNVEANHASGNVLLTNNAISLIHQEIDTEVYRPPIPFEAPVYFYNKMDTHMNPELFISQIPWLHEPIPTSYSSHLQKDTSMNLRTKTLLLARVMGHTPFDDVSSLRNMIVEQNDKQVERLILHMITDVAKRKKLDDDDMLWWSEYVAHSTSRAAPMCKHALEQKPTPVHLTPEPVDDTPNPNGESKSIPPEERPDWFGRSLKTFAPYFMPRKTRARIEHCLQRKEIPFKRQDDWTIKLATVTIHLRRGPRALHIVMTPLHDDEVCLLRAWKCLY